MAFARADGFLPSFSLLSLLSLDVRAAVDVTRPIFRFAGALAYLVQVRLIIKLQDAR